jgi:hypothetical protein
MTVTTRSFTLRAITFAGLTLGLPVLCVAQTTKTPETVTLSVQRQAAGPGQQAATAAPSADRATVRICPTATADCSDRVKWQINGETDAPNRGEYLLIRHMPEGAVSERCFASKVFRVDLGAPAVDSGPVQRGCEVPTVWYYEVELWSDSGTPDKPGDDRQIGQPLDPGVIIDRNN